MSKVFLLAAFGTFIDQFIKFLIHKFLSGESSIMLIENFFSLTYVRNYGAAFSILEGSRYLFLGIACLSIVAIYFLFLKNKKLSRTEIYIYALLIAGILGNFIDRAFRGYVIDYLDFTFFSYPFPIFNFADICIVVSVFSILFLSKKVTHEQDHSKK